MSTSCFMCMMSLSYERAEKVLRTEIGQHFVLREESIGKPANYLGGKLREVTLDNGTMAWAFGSCQYVQSAVNNVEEYLASKGGNFHTKPLLHFQVGIVLR